MIGVNRIAAAGVALVVVLAACGSADDGAIDPALGGDTTREIAGAGAFEFPAPTLTNEERRTFEVGDSFFTQNWVVAPSSTDARDGLGPMFNARACASCHLQDGRGIPDSTGGELGLLLRLSVPGVDEHGGPKPHSVYGGQLQDLAVDGVPAEGELVITTSEQPGEYGDGTPYTLLAPTYKIENLSAGPISLADGDAEIAEADDAAVGDAEVGGADAVMISPRLAPQMVGMGLLEAIAEADLLANADPDDADGDGISGRPNQVWNPATESIELGRFGWKANVATVEAQVAGAFAGDIGITSSLQPDEACTSSQTACLDAPSGGGDGQHEVSDDLLASVTFYSRTLAVPAARDVDTEPVRNGAEAFDDFGCSSCHVTTFTTGPLTDVGVEALADQTIHPYTDLLLHDMGDALADGRPDFEASGSEWRTAPLWGIGLIDDVNGQRALLHDGRARTIEEAILWHGGEAEAAREAFRTAPADQRADLVAFLEAL